MLLGFKFLANYEGFMSRIKIILLILIIAALSIVFIQNREPVALKLLCGYGTSLCLFQSRPLPLAIWIGLFTLLGAIANLLIQTLYNYGYENSGKQKLVLDDDLYPSKKNKSWRKSKSSTIDQEEVLSPDKFSEANSYEIRQEPQNVERSGSTYSYKYREAADRPPKSQENNQTIPTESEIKFNTTQEQDDEDWI